MSSVADTHAEIAWHAGEIAKLFKEGAKVTILVRNPGRGKTTYSADMYVSDDQLGEIVKSLRFLAKRPLSKLQP